MQLGIPNLAIQNFGFYLNFADSNQKTEMKHTQNNTMRPMRRDEKPENGWKKPPFRSDLDHPVHLLP